MKKVTLIFFVIINTFYGQTESRSFIKDKICNDFSLNYILSKPQNTNDLKPLIVFLHGSGERGTDLNKLSIHGPLNYIKTNKLDAYILVPQCPQDKYWDSEQLFLLIQKIIKENKINSSKIYLTGLSMGAWGAWNLVFEHPDLFAAMVPIAGFVDRLPMVENCKIKNIPIRIYHGLQDDVVSVNYAIAIYDKLKDCHNDIKLEIFEDANHDSWTRVYNNPEIYDWMLQQEKNKNNSKD